MAETYTYQGLDKLVSETGFSERELIGFESFECVLRSLPTPWGPAVDLAVQTFFYPLLTLDQGPTRSAIFDLPVPHLLPIPGTNVWALLALF